MVSRNPYGEACGYSTLPEGGNLHSEQDERPMFTAGCNLAHIFFIVFSLFYTLFHILYHDSVVLGTFISVSHFYYSIHSRFYYFALFSIWISVAQMIFFISVFHLPPYYLYFLRIYLCIIHFLVIRFQ